LAEEKQTNIENSDSNGEQEKQDVSSKSESETTDNEMDAQPLFEQTVILEGKRSRKPTLRLEISEFLPTKKELSIPQVSHRTNELILKLINDKKERNLFARI
jgi:hypothetical protein